MKNYLAIMLLVFAINPATIAQGFSCKCQVDNEIEGQFSPKLVGRLFVDRYIGQPAQYFNNWALGEVYLANGLVAKEKYLRYNGFLDELLWVRDSDYKTVQVDKSTIVGFKFCSAEAPNGQFVKTKLENRITGETSEVFLQELAQGEISLFVYREVQILPNSGELYPKHKYYLQNGAGYVPFNPNRWSLLRLFKENKPKMRNILIANMLFVKRERQLIKAIEIYNSGKKD